MASRNKRNCKVLVAEHTQTSDVGAINLLTKWDRIVYTDGGCKRNPGGAGGLGVVIIDTETGEITERNQGYLSTTNNRMEVMAAIVALKQIPDGCNVFLHSDSQYLLNTISGKWKKQKNTDLWSQLDAEILRMGTIATRWVRGHNGDTYNEKCDELATQAMESRPTLIPDEGYVATSEETSQSFSIPDRKPSVDQQQRRQQSVKQQNSPQQSIPNNLNGVWKEDTTAESLVKKEGIHLSCAQQICSFYKKTNHRFADYMKLKTGGMDVFSRKAQDYFIERFGEAVWNQAEELAGSGAITALRWHARGLLLSDSIRKAQVDAEVSVNCLK